MKTRSLLTRVTGAASAALVAATAAVALTATSAGAIPVPSGSPRFFIGKVNADRGAGSDTTFFAMQKITDLYNQAALYGCTLTADNKTCDPNGDLPTTNTQDNYDRVEQSQGVDLIGSSNGIGQLCGTKVSPLPVDYARASRAVKSSDCSTAVGQGYAKDAVQPVDFPTVNPSAFGATTGPVAAGWRPGDPVGGPYSGVAFTNLTNNDNGGGVNSTAYRIYCATDATRITDWGQLTDPAHPVGQGSPIGQPIVIFGVNPGSGTFATFNAFVQSGVAIACNSNINADPAHNGLIENNASQLSNDVVAEHPGDSAAQATELAAALYYESNGVYNTNSYAKTVQLTSGGVTTSFIAFKMKTNGVAATTGTILAGTVPTVRTLFNVYRTDTVRASTAGFLNWICDNNASTHGKDQNTGLNYNDELTNVIATQFGFPRIGCALITAVGDPNS